MIYRKTGFRLEDKKLNQWWDKEDWLVEEKK